MSEGGHPAIYVASPLGFTEPTRVYYAQFLLPAIRAAGFEPLDPWDAPSEDLELALAVQDPDQRRVQLRAANDRLGAANATLIRRSAGVLAVLDGPDVDSGTAAEIGYAAALGTPVTGWRSDFRTSGDNDGSLVNLQVEYFIHLHGGRVHLALPEALDALRIQVSAVSPR